VLTATTPLINGAQGKGHDDDMKTTTVGMAIAATTIGFALASSVSASAQVDEGPVKFSSPSGNVHCVVDAQDGPTPTALCQIANKTFSVPPGSGLGQTGQPCPDDSGSGNDLRLDQGQPGFIRCSFAALSGGVGPWPVLEYGQSRSFGAITCESQPSGVTCTDTSTGHFFRVSRSSYELG